jgi:hypothetical protein
VFVVGALQLKTALSLPAVAVIHNPAIRDEASVLKIRLMHEDPRSGIEAIHTYRTGRRMGRPVQRPRPSVNKI